MVTVDGDPWFVTRDLCAILGIAQPESAFRQLEDDEKGMRTVHTPGGPQKMSVCNESGLYALIFKSRKPDAKRFRQWVTSEVLPAIRKTGAHVVPAAAAAPALPNFTAPVAAARVSTFDLQTPL
ncbi:BRO-N domain-containing protein [Burkholderia stagnalis]|uniref:BRO-N domain-containing protein n=1 Tax=Burkholderia stagnalis TaxID=1503054 RepID=UPI001C8AF603|nr:Bro-N domain-containing protein [Burkholderia stagnalis]